MGIFLFPFPFSLFSFHFGGVFVLFLESVHVVFFPLFSTVRVSLRVVILPLPVFFFFLCISLPLVYCYCFYFFLAYFLFTLVVCFILFTVDVHGTKFIDLNFVAFFIIV